MADEGLLDRVPPHSPEAEIGILGSCLLDFEATGLVIEEVRPKDFYKAGNARIFEVITDLYDKGQKPDVVTVQEELVRLKLLDAVGGPAYLREITDQVPSSANVETYAEIVREKALLRDLIAASSKGLEDIFDSSLEPREVLDKVEQRIFEIAAARSAGHDIASMGEILKETWTQLEELHSQKGKGIVTGLSTGFSDLDAILGGLQKGDFLVLAGRPSMGKSTLALNIATHVACEEEVPVLLFSLEMNQQSLARNMLCAVSEVDSHRLRRNFLRDEEWGRLSNRGMGRLFEAPIFIDDSPTLSTLELRAKARRMTALKEIRLIIVDYLQLIQGPRADSREQQVSAISRSLKAIARELDLPLVATSQLNRRAVDREGNRPRLSDLRESGAIEQDADVVMLIHRPDYYEPDAADPDAGDVSPTKLIIAKQRNGPTGEIDLTFMKQYLKFQPCDTRVAEPI